MKKEEDKEPMFRVVESPRSKKEKTKNGKEQEEKGKKSQPPAWKVNEAKEQASMRRMDEREKEKERCKGKEKAIMAVDTNDEYEYIRVEGMIDSGAFDTISQMELVGGNEVRETEMSNSKECYSACNGTELENTGCATIERESDEGVKVKSGS